MTGGGFIHTMRTWHFCPPPVFSGAGKGMLWPAIGKMTLGLYRKLDHWLSGLYYITSTRLYPWFYLVILHTLKLLLKLIDMPTKCRQTACQRRLIRAYCLLAGWQRPRVEAWRYKVSSVRSSWSPAAVLVHDSCAMM